MRTARRRMPLFVCAAAAVASILGGQTLVRAVELSWDANGSAAGTGGGGTWNVTVANWWNGSTFTTWDNALADSALFAGPAGTVNLSGSLVARGINFQSNYSLAGNGSLSLVTDGAGGPGPRTISAAAGVSARIFTPVAAADLQKIGAGTLTLADVGSLTGSVNCSEGTLVLGGGTLNAPLSGSGVFVKDLSPSLELKQTSTFANRFILQRGRLNVHADDALGTGTLTVPDLAFQPSLSSPGWGVETKLSNPIELQSSLVIWAGNSNSSLRLTGPISGEGALFIDGTDASFGDTRLVTLAGDVSNWTGSAVVSHGTLAVATMSSAPHGNIAIGELNSMSQRTDAGFAANGTLTRALGSGPGQIRFLSGNNGQSAPSSRTLAARGGTLYVNFGGAASPATVAWGSGGHWADGRMMLHGGAANEGIIIRNPFNLSTSPIEPLIGVSGTGSVVFEGALSGSRGLEKTGSGTLMFTVANSYTGETTISGGRIIVAHPGAIPATSIVHATSYGGGLIQIAPGITATIGGVARGTGFTSSVSYPLTIDASAGTLQLYGNIGVSGGGTALTDLKLLGNIDIGAAPRTWSNGGMPTEVTGIITGTAPLTVNGFSGIKLRGQNRHSGGMTIGGLVEIYEDSIGPAGAPASGPLGTGPIAFTSSSAKLMGRGTHDQRFEVANPIAISANLTVHAIRFTGPATIQNSVSIFTSDESSHAGSNFAGSITSTGATLNLYGPFGFTFEAANPNLMSAITIIPVTRGGTGQVPTGGLTVYNSQGLGTTAAGTTVKAYAGLGLYADITGEPILLDSTGYTGTSQLEYAWFGTGAKFTGDVHFKVGAVLSGNFDSDIINDTPNGAGTLWLSADSTVNHFRTRALGVTNHIALRTTPTPRASKFVTIQEGFDSNQMQFDLGNNALVNDYDVGTPTPMPTLLAWVKTGRNGGNWQGLRLTSSMAIADPARFAVGIAEATSLFGQFPATFMGESIDATSVLIRATYVGDADLNGVVNFDDYSRIDNGFNNRRTGWVNGDFDYNNQVNFDDYALIDLAFNTQTGPPVGMNAVPEPATGLPVLGAAIFALARRRRVV